MVLNRQLGIMRSIFGNQYILVRLNGHKVSWNDVVEEEEVAAQNACKRESRDRNASS